MNASGFQYFSNKKDLYGGKGGGVPGAKYLGTVKKGDTSFPIPTNDGDYVKVNPSSELPFTIQGITFNTSLDQAMWDKPNNKWILNPGAIEDTSEIPVSNPNTESIDPEHTNTQQDINIQNVKNTKQLVFEFNTPSNVWNISHLLDKFPSIKLLHLVNGEWKEFYGTITYPTANNIKVDFNSLESGKAIVN